MTGRGKEDGSQSGEEKLFFSGSREVSSEASLDKPGSLIGRYKIISLLGEGGYGLVYLAEQQQPVRRQIALKIVKPGMDSKEILARFEAERQALALLDHPNIAKIFDAGSTDAGRPYFVMEHIDGLPITEYCDHHTLSIEGRLRVFVKTCEAVQHAHQKGIIHRDIKPTNILVCSQDDQPVPKIIDFGVARAIGQPLTDRTLFTSKGQLMGTPEYMSPEQVDMASRDIDTRSDVYSLGAVLYELVTGALPFEAETLRGSGIEKMRKTIREQDPLRPSTRLSRLGEEAHEIARKRRTDKDALTKCIRRELEWIPLKAMRKERDHRYRSASELGDDIRNYLNGNPLIAGPESTIYRIKKLVRRRRGLVAAAGTILMTLVVGLVVSTVMYSRAEVALVDASGARKDEAEQRQIAEHERDRALKSQRQAQKRLVDLLEQQGRQLLKTGNVEESLVILNEAYQSDGKRLALHFLLAEGVQRFQASTSAGESVLIPWLVDGEKLEPVGFAFSPNREHVALVGSDRNNISVFETDNGSLEATFILKDVERIAFTPDGRHVVMKGRLASTNQYRLQVIELQTGNVIVDKTLPDVLSRIDELCQLEEIQTADRKQVQLAHERLYIDRFCRWLAVPYLDLDSRGTSAFLFDLTSEQPRKNIKAYPHPALFIAFSPDGRHLLSANYRRAAAYGWDVATGVQIPCSSSLDKSCAQVFCEVRSPDSSRRIDVPANLRFNKDASAGLWHGQGEVARWNNCASAGFGPASNRFITKQVGPIGPDPTENYAPAVLWNAADGGPVAKLSGPELKNWHFTPDSALLITEHENNEIRIWNAIDGSLINAIPAERGQVVLDISPKSDWLVTHVKEVLGRTTIVSLETYAEYDLQLEGAVTEDLSHGLLALSHDRVFKCSNEAPDELPRFNADGSRLITPEGLRLIASDVPPPEEFDAWVKANIPLRLENGTFRNASAEEKIEAKISYTALKKGAEHPDMIRLRLEQVDRKCRQLMDGGNLSKATDLVTDMLSWLSKEDAELSGAGQHISKDLSLAYFRRARKYERQGNYEAALTDYQAAVRFDEGNAEAYGRLSWLEATCKEPGLRSGTLAVANARKACDLTKWTDPHLLAILAAAYAETGDFYQATQHQEKAFTLLPEPERPRWEANFNRRLQLYRGQHKYDRSRFWDMPTEHLVAWWELDDGKGTVAADSSGNAHHGVLVGDPNWEAGQLGGALRIDWNSGKDEYVNCGNSRAFDITDAMTLSGWMKVEQSYWRSTPLISKGSIWHLRRSGGTDKMRFGVVLEDEISNTESEVAGVRGRTKVEDGRWHHIVGVCDGETAFLYVDGILDGDSPARGTITTNEFAVFIGQNAENRRNRQWLGLIDDVRIYDRALSSEEVVELFYLSSGSENSAPVARAGGPFYLTWPDYTVQVDAAFVDDGKPEKPESVTVEWSVLGGPGSVEFLPSSKIEDPCVIFSRPGAYELLLSVSDGDLTAIDTLRVAVYPEGFDGLVARYTFDDGTARNSSSIDGLHGKLVGNATIVSDPQRGSVLSLTKDGYVDCGTDARFDVVHELTVVGWIRTNVAPGKWEEPLISKWRSYNLSRYRETGQMIFICTGIYAPPGPWDGVCSEKSVTDDDWHHVAGVFDGKEMRFYVDGQLDSSCMAQSDEINVTSYPVHIGCAPVGAASSVSFTTYEPYLKYSVLPPSDMLIDDVRIYNRALKREEIEEIYKQTK